jgi:hypothetical protein
VFGKFNHSYTRFIPFASAGLATMTATLMESITISALRILAPKNERLILHLSREPRQFYPDQ